MTEQKKEKCEACYGSGYINFWTDDGHISMRTCRRCDGYGYIKAKPMTNEEWLKSLDTEGLVDYLYEVHKGGNSVERQRWIENHKERVKMQFRGWLKEIHE